MDDKVAKQPPDEDEEDASCNRKSIRELLGDVRAYSLAGLCAVLLGELYDETNKLPLTREMCDEVDEFLAYALELVSDFKASYMEKLVRHLELPDVVNNTMTAFFTNEISGCMDTFIPAILSEPSLGGNGTILIQDLVVFSIHDGLYDARSRVLMYNLSVFLQVKPTDVEVFEENAIDLLSSEAHIVSAEVAIENARKARKKKIRRRVLIAAATIGGGALIGLTGGLAVPLLAAGVGAVVGGAGVAAIGSVAGMAVIGSLFGVAGAGLTGYKMKKRVGNVEEFAFEDLTEGNQLHITIAVTGWISETEHSSYRVPWESLYLSKEQYCLRYESKYLLQLGKSLESFMASAVAFTTVTALKATAYAGVVSAMALPATIIQLASIIDNPWSVCLTRSEEIGRLLADTLIVRQQGQRPVSLIGYSLGARVIFYCLKAMAEQKGHQGIIEDVILLGAPVSGDVEEWVPLEKVVSGRIINGFSSTDWLLKLLYRATKISTNIAGLQPIAWKNRRMNNVNLSDIVSGHFDYSKKIPEILQVLGIRTKKRVWKQETMIRRSKTTLARQRDQTAQEAVAALQRVTPLSPDPSSQPATLSGTILETAPDFSVSSEPEVLCSESQSPVNILSDARV